MTDTPSDTTMGPDVPTTKTRSTRRTRRLAIIGVLALVLVAGAVLVGVKTTGSRSGTVSTAATKDPSVTLTCTREHPGAWDMSITLNWTALPAGSSRPTVWERGGSSPNFTYNSNVGDYVVYSPAYPGYPTQVTFHPLIANNYSGRTEVISWKPNGTSGTDTSYAEVWCPKVG